MNRKLLSFLFLLCLVFFSCSTPTEECTENFMRAMWTGKFELAKVYCTERTTQKIDNGVEAARLGLWRIVLPKGNFKFKYIKTTFEGDRGRVYYNDGQSIFVRKINGKWLVDTDFPFFIN